MLQKGEKSVDKKQNKAKTKKEKTNEFHLDRKKNLPKRSYVHNECLLEPALRHSLLGLFLFWRSTSLSFHFAHS